MYVVLCLSYLVSVGYQFLKTYKTQNAYTDFMRMTDQVSTMLVAYEKARQTSLLEKNPMYYASNAVD